MDSSSVYLGQGRQEVKVGREEQKFSSSRVSQGLGTSSERITSTFSLDLPALVYFNKHYIALPMCQALF